MERDIRWLPFLSLVVFAGLSLAWSADWRAGLIQWQNLAACAGIAWLTARSAFDPRWGIALALPLLVALHFLLFSDFWGGVGNENVAAEVMLIGAAFLWRTPFVLVPIGYLLLMNGSDTKWVVLLALLMAWAIKTRFWWLVSVLILAAVNAALFHSSIQTSLLERAEIWWNTLMLWAAHPILGVGFGGYDATYPAFQEAHAWFRDETILRSATVYAGSAHNEYLQVLVEHGLIGFAIACWCVWELAKGRGREVLLVIGALAAVGPTLHYPTGAFLFSLCAGLLLRSRLASGTPRLSSLERRAHWLGMILWLRSRPITRPFGNTLSTLSSALTSR